jgi:hypothetical protein
MNPTIIIINHPNNPTDPALLDVFPFRPMIEDQWHSRKFLGTPEPLWRRRVL